MAGNAWEWTSSLYMSYPYRKNDGRENHDSTDNRVLRGGSWLLVPRGARVACRALFRPVYFDAGNGFRLVWVPDDSAWSGQ